MNRHSYIDPGYADRQGRRSEYWVYVVGQDSNAALTLSVRADKYPDDFPTEGKPDASDLSLHVNYVTDREQVRRSSRPTTPCSAVAGGKCFVPHTTGIGASAFFKEHWSPEHGYEQPESFWLAMEARHREEVAKYPPLTTYQRCAHCDGTGTVPV